MDAGAVHKQKVTHEVSKTNHLNKTQRIIFILFLLAFISLGIFIILQLLLGRTP
jgi:hypothetical protein